MDRGLIEAAKYGNVEKLHNLIKYDPLLLRAANLADGDNPLHMACNGGHVEFVKQILNLTPVFAQELNRDGFSPLHIASASGDLEIVKELLKLGGFICLLKGKEKRVPLHCAVVKGRIKVISELLSVCSDSVKEVTARGESCFHLAVKNNQFEAFKVLCEHTVVSSDKEYVLNGKDEQGNTILHLAASRKQYEVLDLLLDENFIYKSKLELNSFNKKGLTPLDVLILEGGDSDIEEMLRLSGAVTIQETRSFPQTPPNPTQDPPDINNPLSGQEQTTHRRPSKELQDYFKYDMIKDSPSKARNTLLVIAVLIVTATYQAVLSPPGGVWQDDFWPDAKNKTASSGQPRAHTAGKAVMGTHNPVAYGLFLIFNSIGFFMSLHMMNFLTLGLPLQFELRVALFALISTYDTCMVAITPSGGISVCFIVLSIVMPAMMPMLTKVVRDFKKGRRQCEWPSA
ncbi:ankyrin repeat-containing protein at3g12360 [Phtheirospermum japonicum]|uniref:Ankyrin repeat-containing protein at3g12360 n=1 Tax=Phtheirospermum japonicum TaxID=374723 RepID=A0A830BUA1_9LAMI|nr:ankyrin repeat-containing protein at3g12360 [Phtheirospermum japonicum]